MNSFFDIINIVDSEGNSLLSQKIILCNRLYNQGLIEPLSSPLDILHKTLGIQAQYINHALFNIYNRLPQSYPFAFKELADTSILAWGQRQTYHFYDYKDWKNICQLLSKQSLWPQKFLSDQGIDLDQHSALLEELLQEPLSRTAILEAFGEKGKTLFQWSALFLLHSRQGHLYHKWAIDAKDRLVFWDQETIIASQKQSLIDTYFKAYGPATLSDLGHFLGMTKIEVGHFDLSHFQQITYKNKIFYYHELNEQLSLPKLLILGKFDPLLVSYHDKEIIIDPKYHSLVWKKAGQIAAIILKEGQFQATWTFRKSTSSISFSVSSLTEFNKSEKAYIEKSFLAFSSQMGLTCQKITYQNL